VNRPGDTVTIRKLDAAGREVWRWQATVRRVDSHSVQVEARFNAPEVDRFGLAFRRDDRLLETYFSDRWYNVFAVHDRDKGSFKGWYCNICRPAILADGEIRWEDLALDVVVLPDRRSAVLDEEEMTALPLAESERQKAWQAVQELLGLARDGTGPFAGET
jgi:hypothetical protein